MKQHKTQTHKNKEGEIMNIYDTANRLSQEIRQSEEYMNYKMAKQALNLNAELKIKMQEFEKMRYEIQLEIMQTGKRNEDSEKKLQTLYAELIENDEAKKYFDAETKFNIIVADVNKIIGEAIKDVMQ